MPIPSNDIINLDYAASTPMRHSAVEAQFAYDNSRIAGVNPNSLHSLGRASAQELERCRRVIGRSLGSNVRSDELIFTSGGTEANTLALMGMAEGAHLKNCSKTRVIVSAIEHDSILDNLPLLHAMGFTTALIKPDRDGVIQPERLSEMMGDDVALVSVMLANNETGIVQPVHDLAAIAHKAGSLFHTDAIQGYLHTPFDVADLGVDALSLAGHKVGGPVGLGALYLKTRTPLRPRSFGGGQEAGRRPGTQDLRQIVALAAAAQELSGRVSADLEATTRLSLRLYERLCSSKHIEATCPHYDTIDRLGGIVSVVVDSLDSEELILQLDARGFEVSAGSACTSSSLDASHVLTAMGIPRNKALGSLRISFDDRVDPGSLDRFANTLLEIVERG